MDERSLAGLLATLVIAALVVTAVAGFGTGFLTNPSSEYVAPTIGVLAIVVLVVGALTVAGAGSKRWRENPYW
jgi:hypothetical protein